MLRTSIRDERISIENYEIQEMPSDEFHHEDCEEQVQTILEFVLLLQATLW